VGELTIMACFRDFVANIT